MRCEGLGRGATDRLLILNDFTLVLLFVTGGSLKQHLQAAQAVQLLHDVTSTHAVIRRFASSPSIVSSMEEIMGDELLHEEALVTLCYTGTIGHPLLFYCHVFSTVYKHGIAFAV